MFSRWLHGWIIHISKSLLMIGKQCMLPSNGCYLLPAHTRQLVQFSYMTIPSAKRDFTFVYLKYSLILSWRHQMNQLIFCCIVQCFSWYSLCSCQEYRRSCLDEMIRPVCTKLFAIGKSSIFQSFQHRHCTRHPWCLIWLTGAQLPGIVMLWLWDTVELSGQVIKARFPVQ